MISPGGICCCSIIWMTIITVSTLARANKITVTTINEEPWVKVKKDNPESNDDFSGFIPELLKMVADRINITYRLKLVEDKKYGQKEPNTNRWNGMIGEVLYGKADLAAAPLTISDERLEVVSFTKPFLNFDSALLLLKTSDGRYQQITSLRKLVDQGDIDYGVIRGGVTEAFFQKSSDELYRQMATRMKDHPNFNVNNSIEGVAKVRRSDGKYALIMESPGAEYVASIPPCDLSIVRLKLEQRSYAWGLKKDSHLKDSINRALEELTERRKVEELDQKWRNPGACTSVASRKVEPVSLKMAVSAAAAVLLLAVLKRLL